MANLKTNSVYEEISRRPGGIASNLTSFLQSRGQSNFMNSGRAGVSSATPTTPTAPPALGVPVATQPQERFSELPANYPGFESAGQYGPVGGWAPPTEGSNPRLATLGSVMPGQYVLDQNNPQQLIKSKRGYNSKANLALLGNRSSSLYQIDHIIPIWAGGADTDVNKEVLTIDKNQFKQHVQSVPLTLYAHGKIPKSQALTMALNWENLDQSNLPNLIPDSGMMKLSDAEDVYSRWTKQMTEAPKTSFKNVLEQIPEGLANFGKGWLPQPAQRFMQGLVSGGTFGWAQPKQDTSQDSFIDKAASVTGQFIGGIAMLDLIVAGALPVALTALASGGLATARGLSALRSASRVAATESGFFSKGAQVGKEAIQTAPEALGQTAPQATGMLSKLVQKVTGKAPTPPPPPTSLELPSRGIVRKGLEAVGFKKPTVGGLAKGAGLFAAYGQMTPTGAAGALMPDTKEALGLGDVQSDPVRQFWTDVMLGTTMGFARPGLRGAAPIALPIISHSLLAGESLEDAMISAGAAVGIHTGMSTAWRVPKQQGTALFRGATKEEVDALVAGSAAATKTQRNVFGEEVPANTIFATDKRELAIHYAGNEPVTMNKRAEPGYIIEYKPETSLRATNSISKEVGSSITQKSPNEFYVKDTTLKDVSKISDTNGNVIYEAPAAPKQSALSNLLGPSNLENPQMIKAVNDAADVASINFISPWSGGSVSTISKGGVAPSPEITTPEWINQNFQTTMTNFYRTAFGGDVPAVTG